MVLKDVDTKSRHNFSRTCRDAWRVYIKSKKGHVSISGRERAGEGLTANDVDKILKAYGSAPVRHFNLYNIVNRKLCLPAHNPALLVYLSPDYLQSLTLQMNKQWPIFVRGNDELISFVTKFKQLSYLHLEVPLEENIPNLSSFKSLKQLRTLKLGEFGAQYSRIILEDGQEFPFLEELHMYRCNAAEFFAHIVKFKDLRKLNLSDNAIGKEARKRGYFKTLQPITLLPHLVELNLSYNDIGAAVAIVEQIPALRVLDISHTSLNGNVNLSFFTTLRQLRVLRCRDNEIAYCLMGGAGNLGVALQLTVLSQLSLEVLDLGGSNKLFPESVQFLTGLTSLLELSLSGGDQAPAPYRNRIGGGAGHLTTLTNLTSLDLSNTGLLAEDAGALNIMTRLKRLGLRGNPAISFDHLSDLKNTVIEVDPIEKKKSRLFLTSDLL